MIQFKVSAPGKVILYGEHAVVYGKTAIAASLDLRTTIEFTELVDKLPESEQVIKLSFPKVNLSLNIPLQEIQDFFFTESVLDNYSYKNHAMLHNRVQLFILQLNTRISLILNQQLSLQAFFFLLVCIISEEQLELKPFRLHLDTQLSIGSGLGSSASFAVCLATCFLHWSRLQKDIVANPNELDLNKISEYALNCEKIMHGNPSGIDNSVCTYGSMIEFKKGEPINVISEVPNMKILLIDTKVERSTKALVHQVVTLKYNYPMIIDSILDSINNISNKALEIIDKIRESKDKSPIKEYQQLMTLIKMNQGLLSTLQVSHPSLDKICVEAEKCGLAAKLTGAGGGGYAYILLLPDTKPEIISNISEKLSANGFSVTPTSLGCSGVNIHE